MPPHSLSGRVVVSLGKYVKEPLLLNTVQLS